MTYAVVREGVGALHELAEQLFEARGRVAA
jgi:hypothetical protein